jgi:hypothetical protein
VEPVGVPTSKRTIAPLNERLSSSR